MGWCISFCSDDAWKVWRFEPEAFCSEATWGYWWGWKFLASHFVVDVRFCPSHFVVGVRFSTTHFVVRLWSVHVSSYAVQFCPTQTQIFPTISNLEGAQLSAELKLKPSNLKGAQLRPTEKAITTTKWCAWLWPLQNGVPGCNPYKMTRASTCNERCVLAWENRASIGGREPSFCSSLIGLAVL